MEGAYGNRLRVVFNLEGSGAATQEYLVRTNSKWIASLYARHAMHPAAFSISETLFGIFGGGCTDVENYVYEGAHVADFVFIEHRYVYHTRDDSIENVADGALQHAGDNVVAMLRRAAELPLPMRLANHTYDLVSAPIVSGQIYFTILRCFVWCSSVSSVAAIVLALAGIAAVSLIVPRRGSVSACVQEAGWFCLFLVAGLTLQVSTAELLIGTQDIRVWQGKSNAFRVWHPSAWTLATLALALQVRSLDVTACAGGCTVLAILLNFIVVLLIPDMCASTVWLLIPALVRHAGASSKFLATPLCHHICVAFAMTLALDNLLSWVPGFLYLIHEQDAEQHAHAGAADPRQHHHSLCSYSRLASLGRLGPARGQAAGCCGGALCRGLLPGRALASGPRRPPLSSIGASAGLQGRLAGPRSGDAAGAGGPCSCRSLLLPHCIQRWHLSLALSGARGSTNPCQPRQGVHLPRGCRDCL
ncbi:unnamed protein product [Prorocentrum cordatum]|uniref:Peptidase M28 domain-containing protein n=1 Tax=Prorocentrum cordatum TaxID=2364126 RepID=A0ABN9WA31_9DINO|nr:unnamed protein product [Polarella glacialis]